MTKETTQDFSISRNVRGKKTRNPGFDPGNHWVQCDRCSAAIRAKDAMITWDNLVVCPDDWEIRHPQDFVRGRLDDIQAKEPRRPESPDVFIPDAVVPPPPPPPDPPPGSLQITGVTLQGGAGDGDFNPHAIISMNSDGSGEIDWQVTLFPFQLTMNWFTPLNALAGEAFEYVVTPLYNAASVLFDEDLNVLPSGVEVIKDIGVNRKFIWELVDKDVDVGDPEGQLTLNGIIRQRTDHGIDEQFIYNDMRIFTP